MPRKKGKILSDTTGITILGGGPRKARPSARLEAFPFRHPGRDTVITFHCEEFTCLCPVTGQPDFARLEIAYVPAEKALESKSLKNYLWTYRDVGGFHEDIANRILDDLFGFLKPKWMKVTGHFSRRGGIAIDVEVERRATR